MWGFNGVGHSPTKTGLPFHGEAAMLDDTYLTGKVSLDSHPFVEHFKFVKALEDENTVAKLTIPAPAQFIEQMIMPFALENTRKYYADNRELAEDIAAGYKKFIADVYAAGCRNLQFDDCSWGMLVDPMACMYFGTDEKGLETIKEQLLELNNAAISGKPDDLVINTHVCRGNFHSTYANSGAYDGVAQTLLARENVNAYYLEFDDARSGGFEPLTAVSGQGRRHRAHPRGGKVSAARQTLPQPAVRLCKLRDRQQADRGAAVGKACARQGDRRGGLGLSPAHSQDTREHQV